MYLIPGERGNRQLNVSIENENKICVLINAVYVKLNRMN